MSGRREVTRSSIVLRILKLRKITSTSGATEAEQTTAADLSRRLQEQWGITEDELTEEVGPQIYAVDVTPPSPTPWVWQLAAMLAVHHSCEFMRRVVDGIPAWLEVLTGFTEEELRGLEFVKEVLFIGEGTDGKDCADLYERCLKHIQSKLTTSLHQELCANPPQDRHAQATFVVDASTFYQHGAGFTHHFVLPGAMQIPDLGTRAWVVIEQSWASGVIQGLFRQLVQQRHDERAQQAKARDVAEMYNRLTGNSDEFGALAIDDEALREERRQRVAEYVKNTLVPSLSSKGHELLDDEAFGLDDDWDESAPVTPKPPPLDKEIIPAIFQRGLYHGLTFNLRDDNDSKPR